MTADVQCRRATLPRALELLREVLREPTFPKDEFEVLKRQQLAGLRQSSTEPQSLAPITLERKLDPYPPDDVRYTPTVEESVARLEKLTVEDVRKLYEEQVGAAAGEVAVVGDFDAPATAQALGDMLKDWKSATPYRRVGQTANTGVKGEKVVLATPDKENAVYYAGLSFVLSDADPDYPALTVGNYVFGGAALASRLSNRVRGKEGLSYGVTSHVQVGSLDRVGNFRMMALANPKNIDKAERAIAEELEKFLKDGATAKEVEEARKAYLASAKNRRASDAALATLLARQLHTGRTSAFLADFEKRVGEVTAEQVNDAFRRHVDPKRLVIIEAGDFTKK